VIAAEKEGRGTLHVSQAFLKRLRQSTEMKGQGAEMKKKGGASMLKPEI